MAGGYDWTSAFRITKSKLDLPPFVRALVEEVLAAMHAVVAILALVVAISVPEGWMTALMIGIAIVFAARAIFADFGGAVIAFREWRKEIELEQAEAELAKSCDPRTGRPFGDHGTAYDALEYALKQRDKGEDAHDILAFLTVWREGAASDEWPEFYPWLAEKEKRG